MKYYDCVVKHYRRHFENDKAYEIVNITMSEKWVKEHLKNENNCCWHDEIIAYKERR